MTYTVFNNKSLNGIETEKPREGQVDRAIPQVPQEDGHGEAQAHQPEAGWDRGRRAKLRPVVQRGLEGTLAEDQQPGESCPGGTDQESHGAQTAARRKLPRRNGSRKP